MSTFLFLFFSFAITVLCSKRQRKEQLSRIERYELLYFNLDHFASDNQIEFDLFNQHYKVQLVANENMIPSQINPLVGHPQSDNSTQWFSSRTESCHYFGHIVEPQPNNAHISNTDVRLSLCPNRGIRGSIIINNSDKIWIKPAAYYLDEGHRRSKFHQLTDQHLVYKSSDYDRSGIPKARGIKENTHSFSPRQLPSYPSRKLLASKACELYVLVDYAQVEDFKDDHDDDWYQELLSTALDYINSVDADYTNLGKVGDIDVKLVRFEVVESWSGDFKATRPSDYSSSEIECDEYRKKFREWLSDTDRNIYDAHQIWTKYECERAAGWGSVGCVCDSSACTSLVCNNWSDESNTNTVAHELGHNFGADHDDDAGCPEEDGIMGDLRHGWSDCSIDAFEEHYDDTNSLSCLRDGPKSFSTNYGGDTGDIDTGGGDDNNNGGNDNNYNDGGGSSQLTEIFYDRMADVDDWSVGSSRSVSISSNKCTSSSCVKIKGYSDRDNSITRSVSNDYSRYRIQFDVILNNMETGNYCEVAVKFDNNNWKKIKRYEGDCCTSTETHKSQGVPFNGDSSARTLYIKLSTDGDSSSGGDYCYFDNVYLYGSGSGSRYELDPCLASNPYDDTLCFYTGNEEESVFELDVNSGCLNGNAVYKHNDTYLHFNKYEKWVVSVNEIKTYGSFVCDTLDLLDCVNGKWKSWISNGEDADELIVDKDISIGSCSVSTDKKMSSDTIYLIIMIIVGLILIAIIAALLVIFIKKKKAFKGVRVEDEDQEEIEIEMEIDSQTNTTI